MKQTNKNLQISLKPYSFFYGRRINKYQEYQDLKDLKNASIKELTIDNYIFSFDKKSRKDLIELLKNTNIKKIILEFTHPLINFLLFISKLIQKNTTIKEIELILIFRKVPISTTKYLKLKNAWFYLIDTISSRLVKLVHKLEVGLHPKLDYILQKSPNLKEIKVLGGYYDDSETIKDVLSSEKYLDEFNGRL